MFKGYPNYISNMFSLKNCANNLRGNDSSLNQPAPNTKFRHKSFSYIAYRLWDNLHSRVREAPDLKNFVAIASSKNLSLARLSVAAISVLVGYLVVKSLDSYFL